MTEIATTCPGCGWRGPAEDGPVHPYMLATPACWARFTAILAREYETPSLMPTHFVSVDAYAAQHPGHPDDRRARQSVWVHLAGLHTVLRRGRSPEYRNALLQRLANARDDWPAPPPHVDFGLVAGEIAPDLPVEEHAEKVRAWGQAALAAYEEANPDLAERLEALD